MFVTMPKKMYGKSHRRHFLSNSCQVCKKINPEIQCEICKMIAYCCVEHRREDWYVHSHMCRAIYKVCLAKGVTYLYESARGVSAEVYRQMRHQAATECSKVLGRALQSCELQMLYWPKICGFCYRQGDGLDSCHDCAFVFACSGVHGDDRSDHGAWCPALLLYQQIVRYVEANDLPTTPPLQITLPIVSMADILNGTDSTPMMNAFISEALTYPLTVRHALSNGKMSDAFVIHVVGAELQAEVLPLHKWENYLLHLLPGCQRLSLVFIGPSLEIPEEIIPSGHYDLCDKCRKEKKCLKYEIIANTFYHDYFPSNKPDLIVALNAGLYRSIGFNGEDSWAPTLQKMFADEAMARIPKLISEYTCHEIQQDMDLVRRKFPNTKTVLAPQLNPFASTRPSLNVISDDVVPVIFKNYFVTVLSS